jgi:hypothetical protein
MRKRFAGDRERGIDRARSPVLLLKDPTGACVPGVGALDGVAAKRRPAGQRVIQLFIGRTIGRLPRV